MDPANNYPQICFEAGLTCQECTSETARKLAQVCKGLRGKAVGQLFVQIHVHSACAPMHSHFAQCYREFSGDHGDFEILERKPAAMAAVA
jgi:hypothetical protein